MATIYDIAKACGISPATVSKALSNATDVSAATRERVRRVADEMHYVPDSRARNLSRNRSWSIGILCDNGSEMGLRHYLFAAIIENFKSRLESLGYDIVFLSNRVGNMKLSLLEYCRYRKLDGVFVINSDPSSHDFVELAASDIPKIAFDYADPNIGCISTDCQKGMTMLYNYLWQLGHRDIVYLYGDKSRQVTDWRIEALKEAARAHDAEFKESDFIPTLYYSIAAGKQAMHELFREGRRPSAIICSDDYTAIGVLNAIRAAGLSVPEDFSVCGYDGIEITQLMYPQLTTILQDTAEIGTLAADQLIAQIQTAPKDRKVQNFTLEPQLIIGKSCAPHHR